MRWLFSWCRSKGKVGILTGLCCVSRETDRDWETRVKPVLVSFGKDTDPTSAEAVSTYQSALHKSNASGAKIRAILIASPHHPLGRPYHTDFYVGITRLCLKYNLHLTSDEVYAKSHFYSNDVPNPPPFVSVLSFDLEIYIDPALVHVIYATSKDFCANGTRTGVLISDSNSKVLKAFRAVSSFTRASQVAEHAWLNLLTDKPFQA